MDDMDREVIDEFGDASIEESSDRIAKAFLLAANNNIPKTKEHKSRENNFPRWKG